MPAPGTDRYGRTLAICTVGGLDVNAWLVSEGWALAYRRYSLAYVALEEAAQAAQRGMWRGRFVPPWEWGRGTRLADTTPAQPGACLIKGNINRSGKRIYHVPGERWYNRTKITTAKGERWFCTEEEARAGGWRAAKE